MTSTTTCLSAFECQCASGALPIEEVRNRWFITLGHNGFNSPANNRQGYKDAASALAAARRYGWTRRGAGVIAA